MARKKGTAKQRKAAIKPWRAKYNGTCAKCGGKIRKKVDLVCSVPVIHYTCHPDWFPAPLFVKETHPNGA